MKHSISSIFSDILSKEQNNFWLFLPILFGFGAVFYINFEWQFLNHLFVLSLMLFASIFLSFFDKTSFRRLIYLALAIFLLGGFYVNFYQKIFLNQTQITGKLYVDGQGKIESIKKFYNPITNAEGASLVLSDVVLKKSQFVKKSQEISPKKVKIKKKAIKKTKKHRKTQKEKAQELGVSLKEYKKIRALEREKLKKEKLFRKNQKVNSKLINLEGYQDFDRKFIDFSKNYQDVKWQKVGDELYFPNPPKKILVNIVKYKNNLFVNDLIFAKMRLEPSKTSEFPDDFNLRINAKANKIGAYGFAFGDVKILERGKISKIDEYFNNLRQLIKKRISNNLSSDEKGIALALLIGDKKEISDEVLTKIRSSGLAHLLSISGFHLSLMATIFFIFIRFLLSRSEYLALNYDLKKFAAFFAIIASYFYLKIAGSPLPAQRAFLMVSFVLAAIFLSEKINIKRIIMGSAFLMILFNPFNLFNIGFQLSFTAVIILSAFQEKFTKNLQNQEEKSLFFKIFWYFLMIILTSIAIQIATIPLLMRSFQNVSALGFLANMAAIPLASFITMPLGFLSFFLMPFGLEKYCLILMGKSIILIEKISIFVANLDYSHFVSPKLSSFGMILAMIGILLICLTKSRIWILGLILFLTSFICLYFEKKPFISFNKEQSFFVIYDEKDGLIFSKNMKDSKTQKLWMKKFNQEKFQYFDGFSDEKKKEKGIFCDKIKCFIEISSKKFLILLKRNKINEICKNDFDVIINLTKKYQLPTCIKKNKVKVDNIDFLEKGGWFFYDKNGEISIKNSF